MTILYVSFQCNLNTTVVLVKAWLTSRSLQAPNMPYVDSFPMVLAETLLTSRLLVAPIMPQVDTSFFPPTSVLAETRLTSRPFAAPVTPCVGTSTVVLTKT